MSAKAKIGVRYLMAELSTVDFEHLIGSSNTLLAAMAHPKRLLMLQILLE